MIRPALAAVLTVILSLQAPAARAESRDAAASGPAALYLLREMIERDPGRNREQDAGRSMVRRWSDGPGEGPRQDALRDPPQRRDRPRGVRVLPERCYDAVRTRAGIAHGYGIGCMQDAVANPAELPSWCLAQLPGLRGDRTLYDARCLRSQGWTSRAARR